MCVRLDDFYETIVKEVIADHITPLVTNPGRLMLTSSRLYFQPFNNATTVNSGISGKYATSVVTCLSCTCGLVAKSCVLVCVVPVFVC